MRGEHALLRQKHVMICSDVENVTWETSLMWLVLK